jgi:tetratricopeptide (TPR) repeat protein
VTKVRSSAIVALVLLIAGAYSNSLTGAFVFDDVPAIAENPTIRALWPLSGSLSPPENSGVGGRPLANFSFALNYAIHGSSVTGYHVGNLFLHLGSALLLFGIVRRTLSVASKASDLAVNIAAFFTAACWGVHPLTTASVSYLSQRTELLMGFFYLATIYAFIRGVTENCIGWRSVSIVACVLGMMSKEVMVTAPVVVLLYDRMFLAETWTEVWRRRWRFHAALASTWLVLGCLLTTGLAQRSVGYGLGVSAFDYALTAARGILLYLRLTIVPHPLVFDYGPIYSPSVIAIAVVVVLLGLTLRAVIRGWRAGFAAACFFLLLAPTSSIVPVAEQPIAENRMYLPLAALIALGVTSLSCVLRGSAQPAGSGRNAASGRSRARTLITAGCLVVGALAGLTLLRNAGYRTPVALWSDTVANRPQNWRAQFNQGVALLDGGRAADAARSFERAIALRPAEAKVHYSLGNALLELERLPDAIGCFREAVRLRPDYAKAWDGIGTALLRMGNGTEAIVHFERALQLEPRSVGTLQALGNAFFQTNQPARAIPYYMRALEIDPALPDVNYNLGSACLELGRVDEAVTYFAKAASLKPTDAEIRNNLGAALVHSGRLTEAVSAFEQAVKLKPDYTDARDNLESARKELRQTK